VVDIFQKLVKGVQFVRNSVLPKFIHTVVFVNTIINPSTVVWSMTLHSFCDVVIIKAVKTICDMFLIVQLNQCRNLLLNG
jgi:hypothetical protein